MDKPQCYIIAGANGAGKSTTAQVLLPEFLHCNEFVNADAIAAGLSPFNVESVALQAGRLMLERMSYLADKQLSFAFETTLASRSFVPFIKKLQANGYEVNLIFLYLDHVELAIERVQGRVRMGGHAIPTHVIRRRYVSGLKNLFSLYTCVVDTWFIYNNSSVNPELIAYGDVKNIKVENALLWHAIKDGEHG